jgi:hypothetical protein
VQARHRRPCCVLLLLEWPWVREWSTGALPGGGLGIRGGGLCEVRAARSLAAGGSLLMLRIVSSVTWVAWRRWRVLALRWLHRRPHGRSEDGGRLPRGTHPKAMAFDVLAGVGCGWGGREGGNPWPAVAVTASATSWTPSSSLEAMLRYIPPPSFLWHPGENPNPRIRPRRPSGVVFLLEGAALGRRKVSVLRGCPGLRLRRLPCLLWRSPS